MAASSSGHAQLKGSKRAGRENMAHHDPCKLPYKFLKQITNDFSEERILGRGGFGTVYKGVLENGQEIAVKVLHNTSAAFDDTEFQKEFGNLRGLKHPNIVELVGFCSESENELAIFEGKQVTAERLHMALCFQYVRNGSLDKIISDANTGLNWHKRYNIIKGICDGLKYLREGCEYPIMHFDLKPENILLDKDMVPKIADFGLSKLFGEENTKKTMSSIGTCGYWPPEYVKHQIISKEFDIFSLGVIIVKIMTGDEGYNHIAAMTTRKSVMLVHKNWRNRLCQIHIPFLEVYCYQVKICIEVALDCLKSNRQERPTIQDIVSSLNETETMINDQKRQFNQDAQGKSIFHSNPFQKKIQSKSCTSYGPSPGHGEASRKNYSEAKVMTFREIEHMTRYFSDERLLAVGINGQIFKGICEDGQVLAVRVLSTMRALLNAIHFHMGIDNQYIVRLAGYCHDTQSKVVEVKEGYVYADEMQRILCLEYMPNGSLDQHISGVHSGLDWQTRYGIIKGTCMGLRHLHNELRPAIHHLNLKPSNILLDENMQPKLDVVIVPGIYCGNAYLALLSSIIQARKVNIGSVEYIPPEFVEKQVISEKYDIYSLGVVIIEIMTGKRYSLGELEMSSKELCNDVCLSWRNRLEETAEGNSVEGYFRQVTNCLKIALECVSADRVERPTIGNILHRLSKGEIWNDYRLLDVLPQELCFVPRKKAGIISCWLQLTNKGNDRIAFMLVDKSPTKRHSTKTLCGVVPPRCSYTLVLTMSGKQLASSLTSDIGEFFTLYSVAVCEYDLLDVDKDFISEEYDKFFTKAYQAASNEVHRHRLKVIRDLPATELGTSSETFEPKIEIVSAPDAQQVSFIDVHPTQPWIITTNNVGSLRVWNYATMAMLNWIQNVTDEPVHVAKFIAREKWLIAGDRYGGMHVYSYDQKEDIKSFDAHDSCITTLVVHPTYPFVLSSSSDDYHMIKLWDWDMGWKCTRTFQGHTDRVTQVRLNPDDMCSFASASWDGTIKIWSIYPDDPSNIVTLKLEGPVERQLCVDYFTRYNRKYLITGCKDTTAQIWNLGTEECVENLEGHADSISEVNLHPELPILITGSLDGTVCIWNSTTYKHENIIGFNLGAVYAFQCIEGTRRIVVGCHQGFAMVEIPLPSTTKSMYNADA